MVTSGICWSRCLVLGCFALSLAGCGGGAQSSGPGAGKERGTASGTIKLKGQPIPANTTVTFLGGDGVAATGVTDGTGHYSLSFDKSANIPVGSYKISLTPFNPGDAAGADPAQFFDKTTGQSKPPVVEKGPLSDKYSNPSTSGITRDIKAGNNTIDIDLQD
ncbi:MAG TPA: hypothetical protein VM165_12545 [Planctomycetaceae bacterium]|nr:hypothetical protein [Planctomycetaceae bacterium]